MLKDEKRPNPVRMIVAATAMFGQHPSDRLRTEQAAIKKFAAGKSLSNLGIQGP